MERAKEAPPADRPTTQRQLQNLLLHLEDGALDDQPHLSKSREILTALLWRVKLEEELLDYAWRGKHEAAWLEIRNALGPKIWSKNMKKAKDMHPRLETPRGKRIRRNHEDCEQIDNEVIRKWVVRGDPNGMMEIDIPGRGPTPLTNRVFVANIPYIVDDRKLTEVFSTCGRVVFAQVVRDGSGYSKGMGLVEYTHPIEALQAIKMMRQAKLYNREITVRPDVIGPFPNTYTGIPEGLTDVSGGLGPDGMKLKVELLEGNPFVHSPNCASIPDQPITQQELEEYKSGKKVLGGMVHFQLSDIQDRWYAATPAQNFVDDMITKLNHLVLTAYDCLNADGGNRAQVYDVIEVSEQICKDFKAKAKNPEAWVSENAEIIHPQPVPDEEIVLSIAPTVQTNPNPWATVKPSGPQPKVGGTILHTPEAPQNGK